MTVMRCSFGGRADHFRLCSRADVQTERVNGGPGGGLVAFSACTYLTALPTVRGFAPGCSHPDGPPAVVGPLGARGSRPGMGDDEASAPASAA